MKIFLSITTVLWLLYSGMLFAYEKNIVPRAASDEPGIIYYFSKPAASSYPILIMLEGSSSRGRLKSVVHAHEGTSNPFIDLGLGLITVEQWGIGNGSIDEDVFWQHYTRSQRLSDHQRVIKYLQEHSPKGWNGSFIFLGGSEGGAIATRLMLLYPHETIATINWIGAVDMPWAEQFWQFYEYERSHGIDVGDEIPKKKSEYNSLVSYIKNHPTATQWLGGMTYMYHADSYNELPYDYSKMKTPLLVVTGSNDSITDSSDLFVKKAKAAGVPLTYYREEGMGHEISNKAVAYTLEWLSKL